ncbi:hypothetical protein GGP41_000454 [Bipolaris sorokiniana]|nr:hypothetical protein GGP41_000454 [Bipolaris sorokiniana]
MEKLDSYMKEVMRVSPSFLTSFVRYVEKGFALSTGHHIPAGVMIEASAASIYKDNEFYQSPESFDGFRSLSRPTKRALNFGYGRHACPGRFFAANEIKMVLARMLLQYDVKMPDGKTDM